MRSIARWIVRNSLLVALVGTIFAMVGAFYSVLLYKNLRTNIEELLPTTARSVQDLDQVSRRLESFDSMVVLTFSSDVKASKRFVIDLANELHKIPKTTISAVEY